LKVLPKMDSQKDSISVAIVSFGYGHIAAQAIESVLSQTHPADQIIVVDDGVGDLAPLVDKYDVDCHSWRGKVVIAGCWSTPGGRYLRAAVALFWRETGR
jgi:glycosyltransferase involved in cell wall biosynthesis